MCVRIDKARDDRLPANIDYFRAWWNTSLCPYALDAVILQHDVGVLQHFFGTGDALHSDDRRPAQNYCPFRRLAGKFYIDSDLLNVLVLLLYFLFFSLPL